MCVGREALNGRPAFRPFSFNGAFNSPSGDDFRSPPWTIHLSALRNSGHSLKAGAFAQPEAGCYPPRDRIAKAERRRSCRAGQRYGGCRLRGAQSGVVASKDNAGIGHCSACRSVTTHRRPARARSCRKDPTPEARRLAAHCLAESDGSRVKQRRGQTDALGHFLAMLLMVPMPAAEDVHTLSVMRADRQDT